MIRVYSFGYKRRMMPDLYSVFDCRGLPNPHHDTALRHMTGHDKAVIDYVAAGSEFYKILADAVDAASQGKEYLAFGCVGGRHRSVVVAEIAAQLLRENRYEVDVKHLEL